MSLTKAEDQEQQTMEKAWREVQQHIMQGCSSAAGSWLAALAAVWMRDDKPNIGMVALFSSFEFFFHQHLGYQPVMALGGWPPAAR
jgi:hypothetical protein